MDPAAGLRASGPVHFLNLVRRKQEISKPQGVRLHIRRPEHAGHRSFARASSLNHLIPQLILGDEAQSRDVILCMSASGMLLV